MKNHYLFLKQIDRRLKPWQVLSLKQCIPPKGWIHTLRTALGMTLQELASRMGLKQGRIIQMEKAEIEGAITLRSLKAAAQALNCELIYAIVPKTSLEKMLKTRAQQIAYKRIARVSHSMALEEQSVAQKEQNEQLIELVKELLEGSPKKLWREE